MGFKLVERVYNLDKKATSPSEQAVLLALAYRANDRTLFCYPKQETLAEMTHLSRATVVNALNALRRNGFIDWKSGGLANKKGKYGRPLSNDYKLNLPLGKSKIEKISSEPSVQQLDTPVSNSKTPTVIYNNNLTNNKLNNDTNSRLSNIASGLDFWDDSEIRTLRTPPLTHSSAIESYTVPFPALHCALSSLILCSISKRLWGLRGVVVSG